MDPVDPDSHPDPQHCPQAKNTKKSEREPELCCGLTGPGAGLALPVTLEEISQTLGGPLLELLH